LLEAARAEVADSRRAKNQFAESIVRFVLTRVFLKPTLLSWLFQAARKFRDSSLAKLAFDVELLGPRLRFALALLISSAPSRLVSMRRETTNRPTDSKEPGNGISVGLLTGCVMEGLFNHVNRATESVIEASGFTLVRAPGQVCCGALHAHAGYRAEALELARRNIEAFNKSGCDRVVVNAAGCGAAMKEYAAWLSHDTDFAQSASNFSASVRDLSELLAESLTVRPEGEVSHTVAYDAPCHLIHGQRIVAQPLSILRSVPGLKLLPLEGAENCCGGAGIYNLLHSELSSAILSRKIKAIESSGAELLATGNPGCIMQIGAGFL